ncbi:SGNH hydrolase-type esterase domain-containing protein [Crassisporium funariophilum]|nr:SGNH hydrolase-type esterase domain-containing protein [Crassisporium funariophilum]
MFTSRFFRPIVLASLAVSSCSAVIPWGSTQFLMAFGDSYTTDGFNISAGVNSPVPGFTSSNGPNWVQQLGSTYNVANTKVFNLASGGATIDGALVPPFLPTVLSIVEQVGQFNQILAPKPVGAQWASDNTLFAFWIGINDVGNSFGWTNITGHEAQFYTVLMNRLTTQLDALFNNGARNFLFLTVPPTDRAPLFLQQGPAVVARLRPLIANYNQQLRTTAQKFQASHRGVQTAVFDSQPVFNTLLDNAKALGFSNTTGFCAAYQNGTPQISTQTLPCEPVSSYFWLNSLHPLFTVHDTLARAISTMLST